MNKLKMLPLDRPYSQEQRPKLNTHIMVGVEKEWRQLIENLSEFQELRIKEAHKRYLREREAMKKWKCGYKVLNTKSPERKP